VILLSGVSLLTYCRVLHGLERGGDTPGDTDGEENLFLSSLRIACVDSPESCVWSTPCLFPFPPLVLSGGFVWASARADAGVRALHMYII
jgi:hypothetical protein